MRRPFLLALAIVSIAAADTACRGDVITKVRTDTLVVQRPGHTDTIVVQKLDTIVNNHYDTTIVTRPETLLVVTHDTIVVHDTVVHVDTVRLDHSPAHICLQMAKADTMFFLTAADTMCNGAHMTQYYPGFNVYVDIIPNASMYRGTLLLPGFMHNH